MIQWTKLQTLTRRALKRSIASPYKTNRQGYVYTVEQQNREILIHFRGYRNGSTREKELMDVKTQLFRLRIKSLVNHGEQFIAVRLGLNRTPFEKEKLDFKIGDIVEWSRQTPRWGQEIESGVFIKFIGDRAYISSFQGGYLVTIAKRNLRFKQKGQARHLQQARGIISRA